MIRENIFIEVRDYLNLLRRRWPYVVIPAIIVLGLGILTFEIPETTYRAGRQHIVGQTPAELDENTEENRQYSWIASQYVVNSMTDWANGTNFALRLSQEVSRTHQIDLDMDVFTDDILVQTLRSRITLIIEHDDEDELEIIMNAGTKILQEENAEALPQLGSIPAIVEPIDHIEIKSTPPSFNDWLALPMRVLVAALAGLGLALLMEYIDPRVRSRYHVEAIDLPFVGAIPKE